MRLPFLVVALSLSAFTGVLPLPRAKRLHTRPGEMGAGSPDCSRWSATRRRGRGPDGSDRRLHGSPENAGRLQVPPHTHPHRENVTVLSGTLKVGMGDQFDDSRMMSFGVGSFIYVDPTMHHYAGRFGGDCDSDSRDSAVADQLHQSGG